LLANTRAALNRAATEREVLGAVDALIAKDDDLELEKSTPTAAARRDADTRRSQRQR
jgi:hypothetical protein